LILPTLEREEPTSVVVAKAHHLAEPFGDTATGWKEIGAELRKGDPLTTPMTGPRLRKATTRQRERARKEKKAWQSLRRNPKPLLNPTQNAQKWSHGRVT